MGQFILVAITKDGKRRIIKDKRGRRVTFDNIRKAEQGAEKIMRFGRRDLSTSIRAVRL